MVGLGHSRAQLHTGTINVALDFEPLGITDAIQARVDRIAAVQLVLEDAVESAVGSMLEAGQYSAVVVTGGSSLNCLANQRLAEKFDGVQFWIPPTPGDAGVQMGGAFTYAVRHGARMVNPMPTPYCSGHAPTTQEVIRSIRRAPSLNCRLITRLDCPAGLRAAAEYLAGNVSSG